jgi:hypothetical protein
MDAVRFLLVLVGIGENGEDHAYMVEEHSFTTAMFTRCYECAVFAYVWCNTHRDWIRCDESGICRKCLDAHLDSLGQNESEDCWIWDTAPDTISDDDGCAHPRPFANVAPYADEESDEVPF